MSPEIIQWAIYLGIMAGGWLLRHNGIQLPLLPQIPAPSVDLRKFPRVHALLSKLGPQAEGWIADLIQGELAKMSSNAPAQK